MTLPTTPVPTSEPMSDESPGESGETASLSTSSSLSALLDERQAAPLSALQELQRAEALERVKAAAAVMAEEGEKARVKQEAASRLLNKLLAGKGVKLQSPQGLAVLFPGLRKPKASK